MFHRNFSFGPALSQAAPLHKYKLAMRCCCLKLLVPASIDARCTSTEDHRFKSGLDHCSPGPQMHGLGIGPCVVHKLSLVLGVKVEFRGYSSKVAALSQSAWLRNAETQGLLQATWLHHTSPIDFRKGVESNWWRLRTYTCSWDSSKNPALKGALTGRWEVAIYFTHIDHNHQKWTKRNQNDKTSDEIATLQ